MAGLWRTFVSASYPVCIPIMIATVVGSLAGSTAYAADAAAGQGEFFTWSRIAKVLYFVAGLVIIVDIIGANRVKSFAARAGNLEPDVRAIALGSFLGTIWIWAKVIGWLFSTVFVFFVAGHLFPIFSRGGAAFNLLQVAWGWAARVMIVLSCVVVVLASIIWVCTALLNLTLNRQDVGRITKVYALCIFVLAFVIDFSVG